MKKYALVLPEIFIMALAVFWFAENHLASASFNFFAVVIFLIVAIQIFLKNKVIGSALGSFFFFLDGTSVLQLYPNLEIFQPSMQQQLSL